MKQFKTAAVSMAVVTIMMLAASSAMAQASLVRCPIRVDPGGPVLGMQIAPPAMNLGQRIQPDDGNWDNGYQTNFPNINKVFPNGIKMRDTVVTADKLHLHVNGGLSFDRAEFGIGPLDPTIPDRSFRGKPRIAPFWSDVNIPADWFPPEEQDNSNIFICVDEPTNQVIFTWYYVRKKVPVWEQGTPKEWERNTFQAILKNSSNTCGNAPHVLDVEFRYNQIQWHRWGANSTTDALMGIDLGPVYPTFPVLGYDYDVLWYIYPNYFNVLTDSTPSDAPPGVHRFRLKDGHFASAATPVCGDGVVDSCKEECDLGAANSNSGACTLSCKNARCGDGLVQAGVEKCDMNSVAPGFTTCPAGYTGTPLCKNNPQNPNRDGTCTFAPIPDGCNDINECANTPGLCGAGTCANTPGSYSCNCPTGYSFNGTTCVDINECTTTNPAHKHDCKGNSTCVNTTGSYQCTCAAGYFYNGTACTDIDRCADSTFNTCKGTSTCANIPGGIQCNCPSGYAYNGTTCVDINECTASTGNPCKDTATCVNTAGSFVCECETGYAYVNQVCEKIDECADPTFNSCQGTSTCVNTANGHECVCDIGYAYDGTECVDVDECADETLNTCDDNATCSNTIGGYWCTCDDGYRGDGETCVDIDECSDDSLNNCDENAACMNGEGDYACECAPGFTGDGETCVDIDECADDALNACDENAVCTNMAGGYSCVCAEGYTGDGQTCTKNEDPVDEEPVDEEPVDEEPKDEEPVDEEPKDEIPGANDDTKYGPIMGGGLACSSVSNHMNTSFPVAIVLGLAGLFMIRRRRN